VGWAWWNSKAESAEMKQMDAEMNAEAAEAERESKPPAGG
jgi:hypothetical protein